MIFQLPKHPQTLQRSREYGAGSLENLPKPVLFSPNIVSMTLLIYWEFLKCDPFHVVIIQVFQEFPANPPALGDTPIKGTPIWKPCEKPQGFTKLAPPPRAESPGDSRGSNIIQGFPGDARLAALYIELNGGVHLWKPPRGTKKLRMLHHLVTRFSMGSE